MKAFNAHTHGASVTGETPRAAALTFFNRFPTRRKCNVTEGARTADGCFTISLYDLATKAARSWDNVTKKTAGELPEA